MKKILLSLSLTLLFFNGYSTIWTINNSGLTFTPGTLTITVGDSVNFVVGSSHNPTEVSQTTWNANGNTPLPGFTLPFGGGMVLPSDLTVGTHYYVCSNHAGSAMKGTIIVQNISGINSVVKSSVSIYPNPSNGIFFLNSNDVRFSKSISINVFNVLGEKIYFAENANGLSSTLLDLSNVTKGVYFVRINSGENNFSQRIMIE